MLKVPKIQQIYQYVSIFLWISNLADTSSYYMVYLLCAVVAMICIFKNEEKPATLPRRYRFTITVFSMLYSLAVILSNHDLFHLFDDYYDVFSGFYVICTFLGGIVVAYNILLFCLQHFPYDISQKNRFWKPRNVFFLFFCIFSIIDLLYFWNVNYPGVLTTDSLRIISQILTGNYNNTAPYWHTKTVELFFRIGYHLFGDINSAIACYIVVQVLFVAFSFAYVLTTFYEAGFPKWYIVCSLIIYALLPYNINYSVTLWKDIPFGVSACLLSTSLYRIIYKTGNNPKWNYVVFSVAGIGFSLMRTNGWAAFLVLFCSMLILVYKKYKKLLLLMLVILIFTGILIGPYITLKNIPQTDWVETLGIPFQQIARVVSNERWMEPYEEEMLSEVFDLEIMKDKYTPYIVDPIKTYALKRDKLDYFEDHMNEYISIWCTLGARYPKDYASAYIEQTKGYWNGGYNGIELYWMYLNGVDENDLNIIHSVRTNAVSVFFEKYFFLMEWNGYTPVLYSIGLHVWCLIVCMIVNKLKRRPEFLLALPCFVLILGLWIGTPVYSEFRYAYPLLISIPVILGATIFHIEEPFIEDPAYIEQQSVDGIS